MIEGIIKRKKEIGSERERERESEKVRKFDGER